MAQLPVLIVNVKAYKEATGQHALALARVCERVAREQDVHIMVAVQVTDLALVAQSVTIPVLAEHIDAEEPGAHTGFVTPEAVLGAGAKGTLLNHSEHRLRIDYLARSVQRAKQVGLFTVVCANDVEQGKAVGEFLPDLVAIEPPELIGGDVSVSSAQPDLVRDAVSGINNIIMRGHLKQLNRVIVGAGVKSREDVASSLALGAVGVLVASGVVKAKDPYASLTDLAKGMR